MKYQIFKVPVSYSHHALEELNQFLAQKQVCQVEKEFVANGEHSFWSFCVSWLDSPVALPSGEVNKKRVDYKELLSEGDFAVYARLRDWRKQVAERDAIQTYNVFTNEQLSLLVTKRVTTKSALREIEGIGQTRVEKYGDEVLALLQTVFS